MTLLNFVQRHPKKVIAAWVLFLALTGALATQLTGAVKAGGFTDANADSVAAQDIAQRAFGDPENQLTIVLNGDSPITNDILDKVTEATESIDHVDSVVDSRETPSLSSHSGKTQVLQANFSADNTTTQNSVPELREVLTEALDETSVDSHVTGAAALDYDLNIQSQKDALHAELIAFPLLIIILLIVYRSVGPVLITLATAAVCLAGTQGIGTLIAWKFDTSNFYTTAGSLIGLAVSVDYCLFLVSRYKEGLSEGREPNSALAYATKTAGHAIRFGGLCVVAALLALFWAMNMVFGSIAAAGIIVTLIAITAVSTFVPALITILGPRVFFGRLPGFTDVHANRDRSPEIDSNRRRYLSLRRPALVALAVTVPLLIAASPLASLTLRVPVASASILPNDTDSRVGIEVVNEELDSRDLFTTNVLVRGNDGVDELSNRLSQLPDVRSTIGPNDPASSFTGVSMRGIDAGVDYFRILLTSSGSPDSDEAHRMVSAVKTEVAEWSANYGSEAYVFGATVGGSEFDRLVEDSVPWIVSIVLAVSLALLGWAFRSWALPLLAVMLNLLVVSSSIGILSFGWKQLTGDAINSVTPLVVFAIVFGLSMDYMVLMTSRMKEEFIGSRDHVESIAIGISKTSRLVISAAVIMIGVFLSFTVAEISIIRELGLGLAVAVALDALVVRPLLLPAVLYLVGPRVWGKVKDPSLPESRPTPAVR